MIILGLLIGGAIAAPLAAFATKRLPMRALLILVGVVLDTLQQIESHLLMRHYDGLMKSGRVKGRTGAVTAI